jgi:hypothetical protein
VAQVGVPHFAVLPAWGFCPYEEEPSTGEWEQVWGCQQGPWKGGAWSGQGAGQALPGVIHPLTHSFIPSLTKRSALTPARLCSRCWGHKCGQGSWVIAPVRQGIRSSSGARGQVQLPRRVGDVSPSIRKHKCLPSSGQFAFRAVSGRMDR